MKGLTKLGIKKKLLVNKVPSIYVYKNLPMCYYKILIYIMYLGGTLQLYNIFHSISYDFA